MKEYNYSQITIVREIKVGGRSGTIRIRGHN